MEEVTHPVALLVMDMQTAILPEVPELIVNTTKAIAHARQKKIPVLYVVLGFRQGAPEINRRNKGFAAVHDRFGKVNMDEFMKINPAIAPQPDEITIVKRRVSAFSGSDLDIVLRALGIQHLVLTGVATSGVVLSTVREAADKDYQLTVLSDCCADRDPEVHQLLTTKIFPRQAAVYTVAEWCQSITETAL